MGDEQNFGKPALTIEEKVDGLSASVDKRFDAVDAAFVEQRQYTEFAFDRLSGEMTAGFERTEGRFERMEGRVERMEGGLQRIERKLDQFIDTQSKANALVERRLSTLESRE